MLTASAASLLVPLIPSKASAATIMAVRMWPAAEYTRVTLELDAQLKAEHFLLTDPHRLVVDIEGLEISPTLRELVSKVQADDPFVASLRIAQNRPHVVRLVMDLKQGARPQVFTLKPVGEYQHRLVLDLYPLVEQDPLLALLNDRQSDPMSQVLDNIARGPSVAAPPPVPPAIADAAPPPAVPTPRAAVPGRPVMPPRPDVTRMITIALDPGHGGEDPGASGAAGTHEKNVVLSIARRLKARIDAQPNMRAMLTRDDDYFVPLNVRVQKARRVQADLFVSVHADAWVKPSANGSSVFALSEGGATSTAARWLAAKENAADLIGGVNLGSQDQQIAKVLLDLSTTAQINDSLKLGRAVLEEIGGINRLHKPQVEQAGFAVLKAPDIPSILVETAFISNPDEERRLNDAAYQNRMADAIMQGISRYFARNPPLSRNRLT
ncbi:N-acetylmuramoyl-L-alanine amidase [Pigmentiphaga aceris]|nr:N-acetylmuramoyl-L-alanine amidase [Pigmentiphaga aceris]